MSIVKNGKIYTVHEYAKHWSVTTEAGGLSVQFKIDKEICESETQLIEYVKNNDIF